MGLAGRENREVGLQAGGAASQTWRKQRSGVDGYLGDVNELQGSTWINRKEFINVYKAS